MGQAIGDSLPLAIGVAISPLPIIAMILMLLSKRAGANSGAFLVGWIAGIAIAISVVVAVAGTATLQTSSGPTAAVSWIKMGLGALLLLVGVRDWRKRPKPGKQATLPKWLTTIEGIRPAKAGGLGVLLSAVNPKNLLLIIAGGIAIDQAATSTAQKVVPILVFTMIAATTVALPVIVNLVAGQRAKTVLASMNAWLRTNNAAVMAVLFLVLGSVLVGKGISGFGS
jgi:threonine/homoserine/homoserine lactone efflux protein